MQILRPHPCIDQALWGCGFTFGNSFWLWPQHSYHWGCHLRQRQDTSENIWNLERPWFLKAEHGSFPSTQTGHITPGRALQKSGTIIIGTAFTAGFPQLCVHVWGGGVSCALQDVWQHSWPLCTRDPCLYSSSPSFDSEKCLHTLPNVSLEANLPLAENSWLTREILIRRTGSRSLVPWCHTCVHGETILLNSINSSPGTVSSYPQENPEWEANWKASVNWHPESERRQTSKGFSYSFLCQNLHLIHDCLP